MYNVQRMVTEVRALCASLHICMKAFPNFKESTGDVFSWLGAPKNMMSVKVAALTSSR
jgi:hypothetical protein